MSAAAHPPEGGSVAPLQSHQSPFAPIAEYGFLSDREVTALVGPSGSVEWLCAPRPDSPSIFGAILDRSAGAFRLGPAELLVPAGRRYMPGTNVLETTWQTRTGWLIVRDALVMGPWRDDERPEGYRRPPGDYRAEHMLLRVVRCAQGQVDLVLNCEPVFDYGRTDARWEYTGPGWTEAIARGGDGDPDLRLTTDMRLGLEGRAAVAFTRLNDGESAFAALSWNGDDRGVPADANEAWQQVYETADFWRAWLNMGEFPDHPWRSHLQRAALTLKGLTYAPTGALIAAPTTSLPETPGGERNWDYRYSWVRDSTFALWGLYTLGFDFEANSFFYFIEDQFKDGSPLQVMYGVGGEKDLNEHTLDHLTGYEHARPVRVGNSAHDQHQHDVWGALLDSVYLHMRSGEFLTGRSWAGLERQVEEAVEHWRGPDHGIWEMRGAPQHFVSSKIMCWVACDRGARLAEVLDKPELAARWSAEAELIKADVLENGVDERGVLTQTYGSPALDASLLLAPLMRFLPADDPRIRATVLAIADELTLDGLVLRYKVDEIDDGLEGEEATFAICSFWLVSALVEIGELERARDLCERMLSFASPLGLYAEEIDPRTGRHWGNFPQAFTHLAQINALMHVVRADSLAPAGGPPPLR
ncbi:MAG TPA: glycoside hydrolase family 15 protein [Actinomycetota bacterium]